MFALFFGFDAFVFDCPPARLPPPTVKQAIRVGELEILLVDATAFFVLAVHHNLLGSAF
jgi:hypothetical protein